jgi:hypothetical protein
MTLDGGLANDSSSSRAGSGLVEAHQKEAKRHSGYNAQKVLLVLSGDEIKIPAKVSIAVLN